MSLPPLSRSAASAGSTAAPPAVTLRLPSGTPLPAALRTAQPLQLTVVSSTPTPGHGTRVVLALPDGTRLNATSAVPLPVGTTLNLPGGQAFPPAAPEILLRALPQPRNGAPLPPAVTSTPPLPAARPQPAGGGASNPLLQLNTTTPPALPPVVAAQGGLPLPGPLPLTLASPLPADWQGQTLTLTLSTSTRGLLQPEHPAPAATPSRPFPGALANATASGPTSVTVTLPDLQLPLGQPLRVALPSAPAPASPAAPALGSSVLALLLPPSATPTGASTSAPPPAAHALPASLWQALRVLVPPTTPPGVQLARVLPQPLTTTAAPQPLLLASGQIAQLEGPLTPTATPRVPPGSQLLLNIPRTGSPQPVHVLQVQLTASAARTFQAEPSSAPAAGPVLQGRVLPPATAADPASPPRLLITSAGPQQGQVLTLALPPASRPLPPGSLLTLELGPNATAPATLLAAELPPGATRASSLGNLSQQLLPFLSQALRQLEHHQPASAHQLRQALPLLSNLLPGLLRLQETARTADPATLLGKETAALLQASGNQLPAALEQLQLLQGKPEDGSWRGLILPYLEHPDGDPQQGGFFWRREQPDEDARSPTATRFVVELSLSHLGPVQLDGLLTYPDLWLKLRLTQAAPDPDFAAGLHQLVSDVLGRLDLHGGLSIETTPTFPLDPARELHTQAMAPPNAPASTPSSSRARVPTSI